MQDFIAENHKSIRQQTTRIDQLEKKMEINKIQYELQEYGLYLYEEGLSRLTSTYTIYNIKDYDGNVIKTLYELSDFYCWFEWYKDGIENDILFVCDCEEYTEDEKKAIKYTKKVLNSKKK